MKLPRLTLAVCIGIQLVILAGVLVNAALPIWVGRDIQLLAEPIDPRDLLRGQYARLEYTFTYLEPNRLPSDVDWTQPQAYGMPVYIILRDSAGYVLPVALRKDRPQADSLYLQAQLGLPYSPNSRIHLEAGLESWYASPEDVATVERALRRWGDDDARRRVVVKAKLAPNGAARIVGLDMAPQVKKR